MPQAGEMSSVVLWEGTTCPLSYQRLPQRSPCFCLRMIPSVTSWVSCPSAGDRQEVAPGSFCLTRVPSITRCALLHGSKGCSRGRAGVGASLSMAAPTAASGLHNPPSAGDKPGADTSLKTQDIPPR
ncbi:hypothetical protein Nmel_017880 [Mimus melanotis]